MKRGCADSVIHHGGLFLVVSILVLTLANPGPLLAQTAQSYRQQATEFARSESWDEAVAAYRKALDLDPNDALTHYDLALALHYKGDTKQAVEEFESAIRLKPAWGQAHYGLGAALYDLHDQAGALKELRKAVECEPTNAPAHRLLARVYSEQNDFAAAERELNRAVALKPSAEMYFELGQVEGQLGKLDAAAAQFHAALRPSNSIRPTRTRNTTSAWNLKRTVICPARSPHSGGPSNCYPTSSKLTTA
jgi:tetratricopeptide (TPR) repeat protein